MIREFDVSKIEISSPTVEEQLPLLYKHFPFLMEWSGTWLMYRHTASFFKGAFNHPGRDCYYVTSTTDGDLAVFRATEDANGWLKPNDEPPMTIFRMRDLDEDRQESEHQRLQPMWKVSHGVSSQTGFEGRELRDLWAGADSEASQCCLHRLEVSQSVSAG